MFVGLAQDIQYCLPRNSNSVSATPESSAPPWRACPISSWHLNSPCLPVGRLIDNDFHFQYKYTSHLLVCQEQISTFLILLKGPDACPMHLFCICGDDFVPAALGFEDDLGEFADSAFAAVFLCGVVGDGPYFLNGVWRSHCKADSFYYG